MRDTSQRFDLLPEASVTDGLEPDLARFRLFDAVATVLRSQSAIRPLVIVLDDLHWADEPSLLLLQFLGRDLAGTRMLLLGMYRTVEADRSPEVAERIAALACDARAGAGGVLGCAQSPAARR